MSDIWFTSDLHLNHNKDFIYKARGYNSVEEMNEALIENWNKVVKKTDIVYALGDIMLGDKLAGMRYLYRLNGKIIVIIGNHDTDARIRIYEIVHNIIDVKYADRIKIDKYNFWLSHYPTNTINFDYDANKPLSYLVLNLHGHTHQTTNFINDNYTQYHVGVDSHNNTPVAAEDIIKEIKECRDRANINKIIT